MGTPAEAEAEASTVLHLTMASAMSHFSQIPWCAELINDPAWTPTLTASRVPKPTSEDSFFAETLGTDRTIRHCLTLRPTELEKEDPEVREVRTMMDIGSGLNGHPHICHGGFVATMLDEVMGVLITLNLVKKMERVKMRGDRSQLNCFTAYLNTSYRKPVPTPGVVLCRARFVKQERNKIYVSASIENGTGTVYTIGEGMFIETQSRL